MSALPEHPNCRSELVAFRELAERHGLDVNLYRDTRRRPRPVRQALLGLVLASGCGAAGVLVAVSPDPLTALPSWMALLLLVACAVFAAVGGVLWVTDDEPESVLTVPTETYHFAGGGDDLRIPFGSVAAVEQDGRVRVVLSADGLDKLGMHHEARLRRVRGVLNIMGHEVARIWPERLDRNWLDTNYYRHADGRLERIDRAER